MHQNIDSVRQFCSEVSNAVESRIGRKMTNVERRIVSHILEQNPAHLETMNRGRLITVIAAKLAEQTQNVRDFMTAELHAPDGSERQIAENISRSEATRVLASRLDRNLLLPQFIAQYMALDSYFATYGGKSAATLRYPLAVNNDAASVSTINLKYALENIIRVEIQAFTLPRYFIGLSAGDDAAPGSYIKAPPGQLINVVVREFIETTKTSPSMNYNFLCRCEWDAAANFSRVTPINGVQTFRFPLKYLTNITMSFGDMLNTIWLPNPIIECAAVTYASPTLLHISRGVNLPSDATPEHVFVSGFYIDGQHAVEQVLNSLAGFIGTYVSADVLSIAVDTSAFAADPQPARTFSVFVAARRVVVSMVATQLKNEVMDDFIS